MKDSLNGMWKFYLGGQFGYLIFLMNQNQLQEDISLKESKL